MTRITINTPGGGGGSTPVVTATTLAGLGSGATDGAPGVLRVGTWPDYHEEFLTWNAAQSKWIGNPITLLSQSDGWAMDLGNRSGAQLVDWSLITNPNPYGRSYTVLNGAQSAASATLNVTAVIGHQATFAASGTLLIRDNIITYTGVSGAQTGNFSFTGCSLAAGSGGTIPDTVDVVQGYPGGFGMVSSPLPFASALWTAGLRLQEKLVSFMNGSPEAGGGKALTIAPYWYEYNAGDGYTAPTAPPTGGLGFSASLVGTTAPGGTKATERPFTWAENAWADWAGAGTTGKVPTKKFLLPRMYGKQAAASIDTGECLDTLVRVRWIG